MTFETICSNIYFYSTMETNFIKSIKSSVKQWYIPLIIGILLIILGIYSLATPLASYLALTTIFSMYFLISGLLEIIFALNNKNEIEGWGWYLAAGILNALFGCLLLGNPAISMATLPFVIGFYALFKSFQMLSISMDMKTYGLQNWGWITAFSVMGIIFSFILIWNPIFAGMTLVIWTGLAIISAGFASIVLAFQLKRLKHIVHHISDDWKARYEQLRQEFFQSKK